MQVRAEIPEKLQFLFTPAPYKVAKGGRSGGKSWGFARALLVLGIESPLRIACLREIQRSIKDSVHKLLSDQIEILGLQSHYEVMATTIKGINGTEIIYSGLSEQTATTIKSLEGIDIAWLEEGQAFSDRSLKILVPTIRKPGSEIWVSYNPDLDTDPIHQTFYVHPLPGTKIVEVNWRDNPWHNKEQEAKRLHCLKYDPDNYDNIWEGKCRPAVEGAIYFKQIQQAEEQRRIRPVPYDPMLKAHIVMDLGWEDSLGAAIVQKELSAIRIIEYLEASHTTLDIFSAELKKRPYNWGRMFLPHDGFSGQLNSGGRSTYDIMRKLGWDVATRNEIIELSKDEGIRNTRMMFSQIYFDDTKAAALEPMPPKIDGFGATDLNGRLIECLKRYRRHISKAPGTIGTATTTVRDKFAHGADALRYVCANAPNMLNDQIDNRPFIPRHIPLDSGVGY